MTPATVMALWLPGGLVLASVLIGLVVEASRRRGVGIAIVAVGLLAASATCFYLALTTSVSAFFSETLLSGGGFSGLAGVLYLLAGLAVLSGLERTARSSRGGAVAGLTALSALSLHVLASSFDLLVAVLALEVVAIAGYALVSSADSGRSDEVAVRYFVQGGTATGFTVLGLAVLYGVYGSTGYAELAATVDASTRTAGLGMVLILAAFAFKLGAVPFHSWAPDVFETTPASSAGFLASAPKIGALVALVVLFPAGVFAEGKFAGPTLAISVIATASVVLGNLGALRQRSVGRMLGYSGIAQVGYGLIGVAAGGSGITATLLFAVTYALGAASAFFVLEAVRQKRPDWDGSVDGLTGLAAHSPLLAAAMTLAVLSLTGMPLLVGFWGKLLVFAAAMTSDLMWLAVVGVIGSVVSFGYYGAIIRALYHAPGEAGPTTGPASATARLAVAVAIVSGVLVVAGGIAPVAFGMQVLYRLLTF